MRSGKSRRAAAEALAGLHTGPQSNLRARSPQTAGVNCAGLVCENVWELRLVTLMCSSLAICTSRVQGVSRGAQQRAQQRAQQSPRTSICLNHAMLPSNLGVVGCFANSATYRDPPQATNELWSTLTLSLPSGCQGLRGLSWAALGIQLVSFPTLFALLNQPHIRVNQRGATQICNRGGGTPRHSGV